MRTFQQYIENREKQYNKAASDALGLKYSGIDAANDDLDKIKQGLEKLGEKKPTPQIAARIKHVAKGTFDLS